MSLKQSQFIRYFRFPMTSAQLGNVPQSYPLTPNGSCSSFTKKITVLGSIKSKIKELTPLLTTREVAPFYICDLNKLDNQLSLWKSVLPEIEPLYAVKCNPSLGFVKALINRGIGFDCASVGEIETVVGQGCRNIIYANPIKSMGQLNRATQLGVGMTTVDSLEEVEKVSNISPKMSVLVRISTDDSTSTCPLSVKFGANVKEACTIIDKCIQRGVEISGVAFHVGSGFKDSSTLKKAVDDSRLIWDYAASKNIQFTTLDVGGGFSFTEEEFIPAGKVLRNELWKLYGNELERGQIKVIAELGRFLAGSCFSLVVNVNGVRKMHGKTRVYVNDGLYGNMNCILYDHQVVEPKLLTSNGKWVYNDQGVNNGIEYSIWGPTCDGLDCIVKSCHLPHEINMGDWMMIEHAGAYTSTAATPFNGFTNEFECIYINDS